MLSPFGHKSHHKVDCSPEIPGFPACPLPLGLFNRVGRGWGEGEGLGDTGALTDHSIHTCAEAVTDGERLHEALGTHHTAAEDRMVLKHWLRLPGHPLLLEAKHTQIVAVISYMWREMFDNEGNGL